MNHAPEKHYIGDGVYASNDGWSVVLETDRENGKHYIFLEPGLIQELVAYAKSVGLYPSESQASAIMDGGGKP